MSPGYYWARFRGADGLQAPQIVSLIDMGGEQTVFVIGNETPLQMDQFEIVTAVDSAPEF